MKTYKSYQYYRSNFALGIAQCLFALVLLATGMCFAQTENPDATASFNNNHFEITQNQVKLKLEELKAKQGLDEAIKSQLSTLYNAALENLNNVEAYTTKTAEFEAAIKSAPEQTNKLQRDIEQAEQRLGKQKAEDFTKISDEELAQRLILEKEKFTKLDEQAKKFESELAIQNERPQLIRQETIAAREALDAAQKKPGPAVAAVSKLEAEARQIQQSTVIVARSAELKMLLAEASSNPFHVALLKAETQLLKLQKDQLSPIIIAIESVTNERRQQEAKQLEDELTQAEKTVSGKHALIIQTTRENIQFSRDLQAVTGKIETYTDLKNKVDTTASAIEADFKSAEKKISLAGLSPVLGKILREQRRNLANPNPSSLEIESIQDETALTSLEQFKIEDKLKLVSDMDSRLQALVRQQVNQTLPASDRMMIQAELRVLLNNQKDLLNKLSTAYATYLRTLGDVDFAQQQMRTQANKFADYLDERLLWVPSSTPINSDFWHGLYDAITWLFSPNNWLTLAKDILNVTLKTPYLTVLLILGSMLLPVLRNWAKQELSLIANKIEKIYSDNFSNTLRALLYTLILVLPLPVFLDYLGWFLAGNALVANFSKAVGAGLQSIAIPLFAYQFFYRLFAEDGIAVKHFQWQKSTASLLQGLIAWLRYIIIPGFFLINATGASLNSGHSDSLGRLALIVNVIALTVFFAKLFDLKSGLLHAYLKAHPNDLLSKFRYVWYGLIILIPLVVLGFALVGYYLSALELQQKLIVTTRFIFGIVIVYGLVIRWLTLMNRQLALKNAKQKRKSALAEKQASSGGAEGEEAVVPIEEELIDIPTINAQTIKLLIVFIGLSLIIGLWLIWSNILPAFSFLEQIVLWQHPVIVDNQQVYQPITMTNLLRAGLYVFIVVVSVRNFPGLIELLVFSRFSIAAGGRYAVNQLARYLIITIGFICIANELGGSWSQVQWLVAALSVGLGFGLQEIFANLVSGIILLFERPIRVGDTVTINSVSGRVSRIQMRATTITDWDNKEHIVPNKSFITNQLVNWTLTDTTTRIVIPITIAHGADVELAHKLMIEAAQSTPLVLEDPAPSIFFIGIKELGSEFSIMVFVSELGHRLKVTHNLNVKLEKLLREHHIELPSPERNMTTAPP